MTNFVFQVVDIIVSSLLVDGTAVPRKVARLHLICDILHNSAAPIPSAWKFRQEFQMRLGIVFDHMANIYHSFPGRMTADTFKKQILAVVEVWEDWIVFPPEFTAELRQRLEGASAPLETKAEEKVNDHGGQKASFTSRFKQSSFKLAIDAPSMPGDVPGDGGKPVDGVDDDPTDDVDGIPVDDVDGEPVEGVVAEFMQNDVNAELAEIDGAPADVDGEPMDIDGEPMDDLDGIPV